MKILAQNLENGNAPNIKFCTASSLLANGQLVEPFSHGSVWATMTHFDQAIAGSEANISEFHFRHFSVSAVDSTVLPAFDSPFQQFEFNNKVKRLGYVLQIAILHSACP